ncbi:hypothetical protein WJ87_02645 [Burkholderia ubonensis]|nr:hypothetical protein WJ87_02645 [Burkholderia ubonensis]
MAMCAMGPDARCRKPPAFDDHLGLGQAAEPFTIQQFVTQLAVEALDEPVLPRTARCDEVLLEEAFGFSQSLFSEGHGFCFVDGIADGAAFIKSVKRVPIETLPGTAVIPKEPKYVDQLGRYIWAVDKASMSKLHGTPSIAITSSPAGSCRRRSGVSSAYAAARAV